MKSNILTLLTLAGAMTFMSSCNESPDYPTTKDGKVALSSLGVEIQNVEKVMNSRASYDLNPFIVTIFDEKGAEVAGKSWTFAEMPEIISLPAGHYRVDVKSHEVQKAEWDRPYFVGSQEFDVRANEITEVEKIVCKFSSLKVTVVFDESLREVMGDDVQVTVVANDQGKLVYTPDTDQAGYFEVIDGSNTMAATFTGTVLGFQEYITRTYTDVAPGQHRIITFKLKNNIVEPDIETGYIKPGEGINVDTNVEDEFIEGNPGVGEDPLDPNDRPGNNEIFNEKVTMAYNEPMLNITAPEGLKALTIDFMTDNADLSSELDAVKNINLADAANASVASTYGLPAAAQVANATNIDVDFTKLLETCAKHTGNHAFIVTGTDTKNATSSFRISAPGKSLEAQVEFTSALLSFDAPMDPADEKYSGEGAGLVTITSANGIKNLQVKIETSDPGFASAVQEFLPLEFDLAYPGDAKAGLESLGLVTGENVIGKSEVPFDITQFIPLLSGFAGEHKFTITVTEQTGAVKSATLTFIAQ